MATVPWDSAEGGFRLAFEQEGWTATTAVDDEAFFAVDLHPPDGGFLMRVQRFRREFPVSDAPQFDAVIEGVLVGIEEGLRPMKVLEHKITAADGLLRADFVIRGRRLGVDIMERRRLMATGPVPPGALFLLTAACPAEKFLVYRREFEAIFDSFTTERSP